MIDNAHKLLTEDHLTVNAECKIRFGLAIILVKEKGSPSIEYFAKS